MIRAMSGAVPQLVLPFGGDRPENASRIEQHQIGIQLSPSNWKPEVIAAALDELGTSEVIRHRCAEVRERLSSHIGLDTFCSFVESLA